VTASNSFTDPAGVTHSGELADISDVGASGQWQEVNSGSNIEPIDGETIGTGSEDVDVGSVHTGESFTKEANAERFVGQNGQYAAIQDAYNSLPSTGGIINVSASYDPSVESFPIGLNDGTTPFWLRGDGQTQIDAGGTTNNVLEIDVNQNRRPFTFRVSGIRTLNGNTGIKVIDTPFGAIDNVHIEDAGGLGINYLAPNKSSHTQRVVNSTIENVGGQGIHLNTGTNAAQFYGVHIRGAGAEGIRETNSSQIVFFGGSIEGSADYGARFEKADSAWLIGTYIETNAGPSGETIWNTDTQNGGLMCCRGNQLTTSVDRLADLGGTENKIFMCSGVGYPELVRVRSGAVDCDIWAETHNPPQSILGSDSGTRTRSHGIIGGGPLGGADLSTITGQHEGDRAVADGTSTASKYATAIWDSVNTNWNYIDPTGTI